MNRIKTLPIAIPVLFFATFAFAQEPRDEPKPQQQEEPKAQPKHESSPRQNSEVKPQQQEDAKPPKHEKQENAKPMHEPTANQQRGEQRQEQRHERPAGKGVHIPDEKFRANFGRQHVVVIAQYIHRNKP